jgi:succinyl-CoA synthetase alpha subunit
VSRSGTLTYEAVGQLTELGLGQSTAVGIGGDPVNGLKHLDILKMFKRRSGNGCRRDDRRNRREREDTGRAVGEGPHEKPVVGFIAGVTAPPGKRMGHAGAISPAEKATRRKSWRSWKPAGITAPRNPAEMGKLLKSVLKK